MSSSPVIHPLRTDVRFLTERTSAGPRPVIRDALLRGQEHPGFALGRAAATIVRFLDRPSVDDLVHDVGHALQRPVPHALVSTCLRQLCALRVLDTTEARAAVEQERQRQFAGGVRRAWLGAVGAYPADPTNLLATLDRLLIAGRRRLQRIPRAPRAIIAPHASLDGSGPCAGSAYASLVTAEAPRTVVIVGPNHCYRRDEVDISMLEFETPLGPLHTNVSVARRIADAIPGASLDGLVHAREHGIEMQLPWIRRLASTSWGSIPRIVSMIVGRPSPQRASAVVDALAKICADPDVLLIVTGDLTHYGPGFDYTPFAGDVCAAIARSDHIVLDALVRNDVITFARDIGDVNWCGAAVFPILMGVAHRLGWQIELLDYLLWPESDWSVPGHTTTFAAVAAT